jgi:4-hydroxybenzoate decarboxylase
MQISGDPGQHVRDFIQDLEANGELDIVERTVAPRFELASVIKAAQQASERAIFFGSVAGSTLPVAANLYGSHARLCRLIGADERGFCRRWIELTDGALRPDPDRRSTRSVGTDAGLVGCSLSELPAIHYHERDAGPYFTSAIYLAREPDSRVPNLSFHRSMLVDESELRVRLGSTHDLARYQAKAEARGEALEAALLIGTSPSIFLAACASLPYESSELDVAAAIAGGPIEMRPCEAIDLEVPADTQIVVEGRFLPNVRRPEGPFGEFMGAYVPVGDNHVFEVLRVTRKRDAIFHALVCGSTEDLRPLEAAMAARVYRHLTATVPGVLDVSCRPNAMITIVKIRKQYEGHGRHALLAALGSNMDYNKVCFVVDEDVDIQNLEDVMWAYMTRGRADTRAMILHDVPGFYRDPHKDHWGRLAIDATVPWGRREEFERKRIPGEQDVRLAEYLAPAARLPR